MERFGDTLERGFFTLLQPLATLLRNEHVYPQTLIYILVLSMWNQYLVTTAAMEGDIP